jgi:hypothetical protein
MTLRNTAVAVTAFGLAMVAGCPRGTDLEPGPGDNVNAGRDNKPNPGAGGNINPVATVPTELTGAWQTVLTYIPAYYTGDIPVGDSISSLGVYYYFGADGQYRYDLNSATSAGFCFRNTGWTEWGTLRVTGSDITLTPARATNAIMDSCGQAALDDNAPTNVSTLNVTPEQDATGWPMLRVRLPSGEELLLEKCRNCN